MTGNTKPPRQPRPKQGSSAAEVPPGAHPRVSKRLAGGKCFRSTIPDVCRALLIIRTHLPPAAPKSAMRKPPVNVPGDTSDSASMNIWLHKQVMQKLAANGGKVPADLH